ncbi:hypothetical protein [Staphylococcus phage ZCSS1]|uniref:Phage protein n=1 Tax=Staphylococcus phage UHP46 TaxID=3234966 RepID=A0AB39C863_9CAUD|nr:hypothetical protein [Staphylococcus phage ZCSS1]
MARIKGNRPKMFKEPKKVGRRAISAIQGEILDNLQQTAMRVDDVYIKRMPNYLEITERKLEEKGVVDLKKAFATSSKKKRTKDGGWYLVVPIRLKTSKMSRKTYQDLRKLETPSGQKTTLTDYLEGLEKNQVTHASMVPNTPYKNTTKIKRKKDRSASYFMFRTVSNKSPANAWVLNRDKVNKDNFSNTTMKHVQSLMKWKMNNLK